MGKSMENGNSKLGFCKVFIGVRISAISGHFFVSLSFVGFSIESEGV